MTYSTLSSSTSPIQYTPAPWSPQNCGQNSALTCLAADHGGQWVLVRRRHNFSYHQYAVHRCWIVEPELWSTSGKPKQHQHPRYWHLEEVQLYRPTSTAVRWSSYCNRQDNTCDTVTKRAHQVRNSESHKGTIIVTYRILEHVRRQIRCQRGGHHVVHHCIDHKIPKKSLTLSGM